MLQLQKHQRAIILAGSTFHGEIKNAHTHKMDTASRLSLANGSTCHAFLDTKKCNMAKKMPKKTETRDDPPSLPPLPPQ